MESVLHGSCNARTNSGTGRAGTEIETQRCSNKRAAAVSKSNWNWSWNWNWACRLPAAYCALDTDEYLGRRERTHLVQARQSEAKQAKQTIGIHIHIHIHIHLPPAFRRIS